MLRFFDFTGVENPCVPWVIISTGSISVSDSKAGNTNLAPGSGTMGLLDELPGENSGLLKRGGVHGLAGENSGRAGRVGVTGDVLILYPFFNLLIVFYDYSVIKFN
jgi:hypothetical protein